MFGVGQGGRCRVGEVGGSRGAPGGLLRTVRDAAVISPHSGEPAHTHTSMYTCSEMSARAHTHKYAHKIEDKFKEWREDKNNPGSLSIYRAEIRRGGLK